MALTSVLVAMLLAIGPTACGGPEVPSGPPISNYVPWGAKGAETPPALIEPDHDEDGVPNERDRCPDLPEDVDGDRDEDGCPDPDEKAAQ